MGPKPPWNELLPDASMLVSVPAFLLNMLLAVLLGVLLAASYVRFGLSLSNRKAFARNFILLAVTTALVISVVKSSLALSLGLVGALSIVRFRAAIKEPEELAFLFIAIGIGLGLGAGQVAITVAATFFIIAVIVLRGWLHGKHTDRPNMIVSVSAPASAQLTASSVLKALQELGAKARLRRLDESPDRFEALFSVDFADGPGVGEVGSRLRSLSDNVTVSCVEDRGLEA